MSERYIHLHTHSHYSFLQALPKVPALVKEAKKHGMDAIGLTDAGNMHGAVELYKTCEKQGLKAIIGVDAYVAPNSRHDRDLGAESKRSRLVLLAENNTGYLNLMKLVSLAFTEGFLERPRIDMELLREYKEGLIAIIPSFAGSVVQALRSGDPSGAAASLAEYKSIFGDGNVFIEVSHHPTIEGHEKRMQQLRELADKEGVPLVAQHDVYYLKSDDHEATEVMRRIAHGGEKGRNEGEDFSFVTEQQMLSWFKDIPDAVYRSGEIADRCNVSMELGSWNFPAITTEPGKTHADMLREKTYAGLITRNMERTPTVEARMEYELSVIIDKGFAPYFLAVSDLLVYAKSVGILSTTRGSAAGSLVSYLTGITTVDPIAYKLPFERFLNPERPKAPDIDMDFADNRRDEMIAYAKQKYGDDHVAQIGTFGTMMARAAVRDVSRALGHAYRTGDRLAKLIPMGSQGFPMTITHALELEPELKQLYDEDDESREILDLAMRIEGCARHTGVHAAGVVISPTPLTNWTPLQVDQKTGKLITQYDMHAVEDVGLLKFDFLGIKNLAIIADAVARIKDGRGVEIDIENIPVDDEATFAMLARGETEGTFQLNGSGMTRYLKELRPTTIHDINAMVALYRPGPMETIPQYIERKRNTRLITYLDERMKDYLDASYGLLVYQDDVLLTAITLGGYSWLEADTLRKAMGKKIPAEMEAQKEKLLKGFVEYGKLTQARGEQIWKLIEPFAAYGFNKCLAANVRVVDATTGIPTTVKSLLGKKASLYVHSLGSDQSIIQAKATEPFENGVKQIFTLTTRSGKTIRATSNHPFRTFSNWRELGQLSIGERIAMPRHIPPPTKPTSMRQHEAAVLGYLISEGNLCHPHGIYFYSTQEDELQDFSKYARVFHNATLTLDRSKSATSIYVGQVDQKKGNALNAWIETLGLKGKKATEKFVPAEIFSLDNATLSIFLGKLWQGDGGVSVVNNQLMYATSSRTLADDVSHLLLRFSITSTTHTKHFNYRGGTKVGWSIVVSGTENIHSFERTIGKHLIGNKKEKLHMLAKKSAVRTNTRGRGTTDTVPFEVIEHVKKEMSARGMGPTELAREAQVSVRLLGRDAHKRGITRTSLLAIGRALSSAEIQAHATSDIFWDEVVSIEKSGREMTYDLSVPGPSNFVANDFFVHNSHAACYGKVAYQTAYLKANYPVEYMAALLTADAGDTESIAILVAESDRLGIPVLPPDINESGTDFTVTGENRDTIRFGLTSIKNFGEGISEAIIAERRERGPFLSLSEFLTRIESKNLNKKSLESLIKCGALDTFGSRAHFMAHIETLLSFHRDATATAPQDSLFGSLISTAPTLTLPPDTHETTLIDKLTWEKELLGIYVSGHPLDSYAEKTGKAGISIKEILEDPKAGMTVILPVLVLEARIILTKKGDKMAFVKFEDKTSTIEGVVFPKTYKEYAPLFVAGQCILLKATISTRNGEVSLAIENVKAL